MSKPRAFWIILASTTALLGPAASAGGQVRAAADTAPILPTSSYTLANGLTVIFHIDRSDPVVAVNLAAHVGSSREEPGRTGFAHLFEHLFFLDSENVGRGGIDRLSARVGGSGANGFTTPDLTVYNQEVPNDALEKMIWAEADKLGYFIKTVTTPVLQKEKQVVKNEKRQSYDNRSYGHLPEIVGAALYPADHPYSWQVIGSLADLDAAKLEDVQAFYRRWYVPNNATLVIAGDFDEARARAYVERYFGEIPRGAVVPRSTPRPAGLARTKSLMYEDAYAKLPMLSLTWPGAPAASADAPVLDVLMAMLTDGRDTPLDKLLVEQLKLTDDVDAGHRDAELAGEARITVRAFDGVDLDQVQAAIGDALKRFEQGGIDPAALARAKAQVEVAVLSQLTDVDNKASTLALYAATAGDPDTVDRQLTRLRALTPADIERVYRQYLADRPHVIVSVVPRGKPALALADAQVATFAVEPIVPGAEAEFAVGDRPAFAPTPSAIDRSVEPAFGPAPVVKPPTIWQARAANGLALLGIEDRELPLASFAFSFDGGQRFDDPARPGAANLLARMMTRGTARRTPTELENALQALGADITATATRERILLGGTTLARNFAATMALVREMLLAPRWDANELALAKAAVAAEIVDDMADPSALARRVTDVVGYPRGSIRAADVRGTPASVAALTLGDLKAFHATRLSPGASRFRVTGAVTQDAVTAAIAPLAAGWPAKSVVIPPAPAATRAQTARLYFYDVPDAKQSTLLFSAPGPARADADYYPAVVANYILGGGGFASRLTQTLREGKGYTYGVGSGFEGRANEGHFLIESPVRANVTLEAAQLTRATVGEYGRTFTAADLATTKGFLTKSRAFAFESPQGKLGLLATIGDYGLPLDYPVREAAVIDAITLDRIRALADRYMAPDRLTYVVVGDAASQAKRLEALGVGAAIPANALLE